MHAPSPSYLQIAVQQTQFHNSPVVSLHTKDLHGRKQEQLVVHIPPCIPESSRVHSNTMTNLHNFPKKRSQRSLIPGLLEEARVKSPLLCKDWHRLGKCAPSSCVEHPKNGL